MLLSSVRRLAPSRVGGVPPRVPRRRRAPAARHLGAARRRDRVARVARRACRLAGDGNPLTVGKRFDPRGYRRCARAGDVELASTAASTSHDPVHRRLRGVVGPRDALRPSGGVAATAREPVVGGGRPLLRARPRCGPDAGDGRVLRPQHAGRAVGRDAARLVVAALRTVRADLRRGRGGVLPSATMCRGRRRTSCRRRRTAATRARTTCSTRPRSNSGCASARSPRWSRQRPPRRGWRSPTCRSIRRRARSPRCG